MTYINYILKQNSRYGEDSVYIESQDRKPSIYTNNQTLLANQQHKCVFFHRICLSLLPNLSNTRSLQLNKLTTRVKSGIFGKTAKFRQRPCLFHISNIGIKNKLTKQTVKILMRRLDLHCLQMCVRIYLMSEFT